MILTATITALTATSLTIGYDLVNDHKTTIYVADMLYAVAPDGGHRPDPTLAYAVAQVDGSLILSKELVPIPPGIKAERPEMPYFVAMQPGERRSGTIVLAQPIAPFHPYRAFTTAAAPQPVTNVTVRFGYLEADTFRKGEIVVEPRPSGLFVADYGNALAHQKIATVTLRPPAGVTALAVTGHR